ncbi:discoidin domain-containing protein, partial [Pseudoflavonifractor sp. An85]|uniref:discoidin domain-containing protein n=1 Tax=Pseudoflavonifractor sp. An85 TaxID=1965661 RepID=UPI000B36C94B
MGSKKRLLAGALALATCVNLVTVGAFAGQGARSTSTQTSSPEETVYVNSYGGDSRQVDFSNHWRFNLGSGSEAVDYNDSAWRDVDLPHDYSIEQEYTKNGEAESGYLPGGTGWYRKTFTLDEAWKGKVITVDFGGVYMNATVYLNGKELGFHPYGYTAFSLELPQDLLKYDGENVLAVKVDHKTPSSRWYSGSGIYRSVHLTVTDPVHVDKYGTYVTTPNLATSNGVDGTVKVLTTVANSSNEDAEVVVHQSIYQGDAKEPVATVEGDIITVEAGKTADVTLTTKVDNPALWDTDHPNLYTVKTEIVQDEQVVDTYTTEFGFRWMEFSNEYGMKLNGEITKLQGVCMHHDQGALGSEAWYRAIERQIDILKEMGCNAIRVTHNPAADELVEIANRKGIMLIDEAFDTWVLEKNYNSYDYSHTFNQTVGEGNHLLGTTPTMTWSEYDLKTMVNRDKNAPSVIMYSLGNELLEVTQSGGNNYGEIAEKLCGYVESIDTTRPITFGDNKLKADYGNGDSRSNAIAEVIAKHNGLVGYNYTTEDVLNKGAEKGWLVYHSETASAVNSRGVYDRKGSQTDKNGDYLLTSYDKSKVGWGHVASEAWWRTITQDNSTGEFVWTGFDYIGEPTPWNGVSAGAQGVWPKSPKSSYFGIIDTNGLPKDTFYLYQSQWNDDVTTLHVLPTWNEADVERDSNGKVEVVVYSDAAKVELLLNGKVVGVAKTTENHTNAGYTYRTFSAGEMPNGEANTFSAASGHQSLYATFWLPYAEGTLEAKAYDAEGHLIEKTSGRNVVKTTSKVTQLTAQADRTEIVADGDDLSYITIDVKDADGNLVNTDDVNVKLSIKGDGKIVGVDNGRQPDHTSYQSTSRNVGAGQLVAIVQSTDKAGSFTVTATADGLSDTSVTVKTTAPETGEGADKTIVSYEISRYHYVKVGNKPQLPETVKVNYNDGTSDELKVTWNSYDEKLIEQVGSFAITGTLEGSNITVTVNITMLDRVAALLNYSTTVPVGAESVGLPESRPAVLADGTILNAEFPVEWQIPEALTKTEGTTLVKGTSSVFGETLEVTASVRVAQGNMQYGENVAVNANQLTQSIASNYQSDSLEAIRDGNTAYKPITGNGDTNNNVWSTYKWSQSGETGSNQASVEFTYATNQALGKLVLYYFTDSWSAAKPDNIELKYSVNGEGYVDFANLKQTEEDLGDSNGAHLYRVTYTFDSASVLKLRINLTSKAGTPSSPSTAKAFCVGLTEVELYPVETSYPVNSSADLTGITFNGKEWSASELAAHTYSTEALVVDSLKVDSGNNASYTVLPAHDNVVKILTESEDHAKRGTYTIQLGAAPAEDDPADGSRDYDYAKTSANAASEQNGNPASYVVDGKNNTHWHTNWNAQAGDADLSDNPDKRYIQLTLEQPATLDALRYLPRQGNGDGDANGRVTGYRVEVSTDGTDWTKVSEGTWANNIDWKIAVFDQPVQAKFVRLYGVETVSNSTANAFMSAAEVRVRLAQEKIDLSKAQINLEQESYEYTGSAIEPKVTSVVLDGKTLAYGLDYTVSYANNTAPGTGTVTVQGIVNYTGTATKTFTIQGDENLALKQEGSTLPLAVSFYAPGSDSAANINDGEKTFSVSQGKKVWSDWERKENENVFHDAPWVGIVLKETTTVDRISIGFIDEAASDDPNVVQGNMVRLPASYEIQVYVGTDKLDYQADHVDNGRNWPVMNSQENWKTVATVTELPESKDYAQMLDTTFDPVETAAIRVVMKPQANQWVGVDELEVYGPSKEVPQSYNVTVQTQGEGSASADPTTAQAGATITLTQTAAEGWHFKEWKSDDVTITDNTFTMSNGDVTVTAVFEEDSKPEPTPTPQPT